MSRADPSPYHAVTRDGIQDDEEALEPSTRRLLATLRSAHVPGMWRSWGDLLVGVAYYLVLLAFVAGAAWLVAVAS